MYSPPILQALLKVLVMASKIAFGVIPQDHIVRDMSVVSEMLQPLPGDWHPHKYQSIYTYNLCDQM